MDLLSLGYIGVGARDLDDWSAFATGLLGMQIADRTESCVAFRMDDRRQRIVVDRELAEGRRYFGWEAADANALRLVAARAEAAGHKVQHAHAALADQRFVGEMVWFDDPAGNRLEVFHSPHLTTEPFRPGRSISGFRTGPLGLGHAVLLAADIEAMIRFYEQVLGFHVSDFLLQPFRAYFFHTNSRHHSLALIEAPQDGMHHLMVELFNLDDVGQGYDLAQQQDGRIAVTLGRHTNDYMTSFYAKSPSEFMVEYGWGGRSVDPATWTAKEFTEGPSLWGHERNWLPPEKRVLARQMRMGAAAAGIRAPVQVLKGNHHLMEGTCNWWDGIAASSV
jgi:2,3-dihydroxybiphenyl 1,2-dioxygenase